ALTSGDADPSGEGWLRITGTEDKTNGYALFDEAFESQDGVSISFEVAAWGGSGSTFGADGLAFFLVDGDQIDASNFQIGGYGGSLGYAPLVGKSVNDPGMLGAVLGIGF